MKTIGLLGGMSWESTLEYYRIINQEVRGRHGGLASAKCVLHSVDFSEIVEMQKQGDWEGAGNVLAQAARSLELGGADLLLLCTNTMHKVADAIEAAIDVPFLHIADATARAVQSAGLHTVGLLGTRFTLVDDFFVGLLRRKFGLQVLVPDEWGVEDAHSIIFDELCQGLILDGSRDRCCEIISDLQDRGAEGVILGCTEIDALIKSEHVAIPLFDSTALHARAAVDFALAD